MAQKEFLTGDGYQKGDNVLIDDKMWRIDRIVKDEATLSYYGATGKEVIKRKVASLPMRDVVVDAPLYEAGQKLENGWKIVKATTKNEYMVNTGEDKVVMSARDILQAERDYRQKLLDEVINTPSPDEADLFVDMLNVPVDEDEIHHQAEAYAKKRLEKEDSPPSPAPLTDETIERVLSALKAMEGIEESLKRIDERLAAFDDLAARVAKLETVETPAPYATVQAAERETSLAVEFKTLVHPMSLQIVSSLDDDEILAEHILDGWDVWHRSHDVSEGVAYRIVTLCKYHRKEADGPVTKEVMIDARTKSVHVPRTVMGMIVEPHDPTGGWRYNAEELREKMNDELRENTEKFRRGA